MTLKGHSNNIMFSSVSIFRMLQDKHIKFYFGNLPWFDETLPWFDETLLLVAYKFLIKNLNFGVNQCISGHVIS